MSLEYIDWRPSSWPTEKKDLLENEPTSSIGHVIWSSHCQATWITFASGKKLCKLKPHQLLLGSQSYSFLYIHSTARQTWKIICRRTYETPNILLFWKKSFQVAHLLLFAPTQEWTLQTTAIISLSSQEKQKATSKPTRGDRRSEGKSR